MLFKGGTMNEPEVEYHYPVNKNQGFVPIEIPIYLDKNLLKEVNTPNLIYPLLKKGTSNYKPKKLTKKEKELEKWKDKIEEHCLEILDLIDRSPEYE